MGGNNQKSGDWVLRNALVESKHVIAEDVSLIRAWF